MKLEISPEPSAAERAAIEEALERLAGSQEPPPEEWWQAGLRENLAAEEDD